jgi:hypothetical protein
MTDSGTAMQVLRTDVIAALLNAAVALGCGGKSEVRSDDETAGSSGAAAGGSRSSGGTSSGGTSSGGTSSGGAGGTPGLGLGMPCRTDYDCLRVEAGESSVVLCSGAGRCEIGTREPVPVANCERDYPLPNLELNDSRVYQSPVCASGLCLLRSYSIDPANTTCTSRCATDRDCAAPYAWTTSCLPSEVHENGDTGVIVNVCMPPMPW